MCLSPILDPENSPKGTDIEGRRPRSPGSAQGQKNKTRRQRLWPLSSISSFGMLALVPNPQLRDVLELSPQFLQRELKRSAAGTRHPWAERRARARRKSSKAAGGMRLSSTSSVSSWKGMFGPEVFKSLMPIYT